VRGVAPEHTYAVTFSDGRRYEGVADENGRLDLVVSDPLSEPQLHMQVFEQEVYVARTTLLGLPPRTVTFHRNSMSDGWRMRLTSLVPDDQLATPAAADDVDPDDESPPLPVTLTNLTGTGVIESFVIGGRLQDPI